MSGHNHYNEAYNGAVSGDNQIADPGAGNVDLKGKSNGFMTVVGAGARVLPSAPVGTTLTVYTVASTGTFVDPAGTTVVTLGANELYVLTSVSSTIWLSSPTHSAGET